MSEKKENTENIEFIIHRIYVKDISFECPNSPNIFQKEWAPNIEIGIDTFNHKIDDTTFEIILTLTVTAKIDEEMAFLCEIQQAGIFTIGHLESEQKAHCLNSFCPNILFPYAREAISNLVNRGTFPPLNITPINFDSLYENTLKNQQNEAEKENNSGKLNS